MTITTTRAEAAEPMLRAEGLRYLYQGAHEALNGLDLTIGAGRRMALVGRNGAGKTTLLLHLNGTLRPTAGRLYLGETLVEYDRRSLTALRSAVGVVLQNPDDQLFAGSVYQDVSFGPLNLGLDEAEARLRVDEALAAMDITDLRDRATHMLSGGQKRRVAIAGAVAMAPRLLILDEPLSALDASGSWHLVELINRLHQGGTTIVVATHDMDFAYEWSQDVAIIHEGRIARQGTPHEVLRDPVELANYGLRTPWLVEVGELMLRCEVLPPGECLRTRGELETALHLHSDVQVRAAMRDQPVSFP
jgi:cobalt/nickel transport system ATP-binding protein